MGKNNKKRVPETALALPAHSSALSSSSAWPIVDTHTHLLSTYAWYKQKYPDGAYSTIHDFVRGLYLPQTDPSEDGFAKNYHKRHPVKSIVDVWCEPSAFGEWKALADSALDDHPKKSEWGGIEYYFVMGVHPHEAKHYNDEVESQILEAMSHPRCVGWGEIGLDYHYSFSTHDVQQAVFERQLHKAIQLNRSITIHTREAEEDTERIMKHVIPKDQKIHVHCFTDSPEFAARLLSHFPNLYIGITGVLTYTTNTNTSETIRQMTSPNYRILLETDAPYMTPSNIYDSLPDLRTGNGNMPKLPLCHSGMIPWTAQFVADVVQKVQQATSPTAAVLDTNEILRISAENAKAVYGV